MKKVFLLIASAALLFAGCTKESKLPDAVGDGETVTVQVVAQLEGSDPVTRASWDNDGNGAKVNHWIMEVYDAQGKLFDRQEKVNQTGLKNSFEVTLIKNQTYEFAFWADTKGAYKTDDLHAVSINYTKVGLDSQDAFFADVDGYISQQSEILDVTLHRPLAQLNIVTLDLKKIYKQMKKAGTTDDYAKFIPVDLVLKGDIYNQFNVLDSLASDKKSTTLSLDGCYAKYAAHKDTTTIYMCYGFVTPDKELYKLEFSCKSNEVPVEYEFNNIPLQRNYRTNISGNLLSNDSRWEVTIDPIWETPDYECPLEPESVEMAGIKWSVCNIGAEDPTEAGWYFSWGNTEGYINNGSGWVKASDGTTPGSFSSASYAGTPGATLTGNITPDDGNDAARTILGLNWRMPTASEFQKLYEACGGTGTSTTPVTLATATPEKGIYWLAAAQEYIADYKGVSGILFVDANKTRLFFPVTGYGSNDPTLQRPDSCRYWSSTLDTSDGRRASFLYFSGTDGVCPQFLYSGYRGYAIRPVKDI